MEDELKEELGSENYERLSRVLDSLTKKVDSYLGVGEEEGSLQQMERDLNELVEKRDKLMRKNRPKKQKRISMRISEEDLLALKERAIQERMPYQTLVARLINKYLSGDVLIKGV